MCNHNFMLILPICALKFPVNWTIRVISTTHNPQQITAYCNIHNSWDVMHERFIFFNHIVRECFTSSKTDGKDHMKSKSNVFSYNYLHWITQPFSGIILCMHLANERWCYIVTSSFIGWVHTQHDPWFFFSKSKVTNIVWIKMHDAQM